jgi:hypothetical protein
LPQGGFIEVLEKISGGFNLRGRDDRRRPPPPWSARQRAQGMAGNRISMHQLLEPRVPDAVSHQTRRQHFSPPDAYGWSEVLSYRASGPPLPHFVVPRWDPPPRRNLPAQLDGRRLNCLPYNHRWVTCMRLTMMYAQKNLGSPLLAAPAHAAV